MRVVFFGRGGGFSLTTPAIFQEEWIYHQYNFMQLICNLFRVGWKLKSPDIICFMLMSLVSLQQGNVKKSKKIMKIVKGGLVSEHPLLVKVLTGPKHCWNLHNNTFILWFHHSEINVDRNLHIFWMSWGISMNFWGKMWLMIILKSQKTWVSTSL